MLQVAEHASVTDELLSRICGKLQITDTQHRQAEMAYSGIARLLESPQSPISDFTPRIFPQGSLKLGTTVRPRAQDEFDLDIVCELTLDPRHLPNPPILIDAVYEFLRQQMDYSGRVTRKRRCIRVSYPGQFHLDVLPACPDPNNGGTCLLVPDRTVRAWKPSNPKGYAAWFESRCEGPIARLMERAEPIPSAEAARYKAVLKLTTQLLKRWRDVEYDGRRGVAPISIVLTTLAGLNYSGERSTLEALVNVIRGIDGGIPPVGRLHVLNPTNSDEDLSEKWNSDRTAYEAFVSGMRKLHSEAEHLLQAAPFRELARMMQKMFGEDLTKPVLLEYAESVETARDAGSLSATRHRGMLTTSAAVGAVPVARHTFYGDVEDP
jgi:hypothetical protein